MIKPTKSNDTLHPIFREVKPNLKPQLKPAQTLFILKLRYEGNSFSQIARRLYAERGTEITSQRVAQVCQRFYQPYLEAEGLK